MAAFSDRDEYCKSAVVEKARRTRIHACYSSTVLLKDAYTDVKLKQ